MGTCLKFSALSYCHNPLDSGRGSSQGLESFSLLQEGSEILFTIRTANVAQRETTGNATAINVSYDAFVDDIQVSAGMNFQTEERCLQKEGIHDHLQIHLLPSKIYLFPFWRQCTWPMQMPLRKGCLVSHTRLHQEETHVANRGMALSLAFKSFSGGVPQRGSCIRWAT